jgi:C_GCAxxG_C_C family probable redox protein
MNRIEQATSSFKQGYSCSQSIVAAFAPSLGVNQEMALKASAGFGGGMGRMGQTCGVVTGACMVIGMRFSSADPANSDAKECTYITVKEFSRQFKVRNKTMVCRELLGCDIGTPEGLKTARDNQLFACKCPKFVADAAEILEQLI